jgi:exosortase A
LLGAGFGWLLGQLGGVQAASHLALAGMIACAVWSLLGTQIARAIAFPLVFTFLAVPIGEFLLPVLIEHTADFTVAALRLTGIPVYREGNDFVLPTGSWSVVEACAGLRYLIATITLGLLYAYLSYRSLWRRALFVAASVAVPIVANWLRVYMIVIIGHLSGMKYGVGFDHLVFGWVLFGMVALLLFWVGSHWREDVITAASTHRSQMAPHAKLGSSLVTGALLTSITVTASPLFYEFLESSEPNVYREIATIAPVNGWTLSPERPAVFHPNLMGARQTLEQVFEKDGRRVVLFIGYYANQREGSELIFNVNTIAQSRIRSWRQVAQDRVRGNGLNFDAIQTRLRSSSSGLAIWHWYWAGERWTALLEVVKAFQALDKLLGRGDDAAVVVLYTQSDSERRGIDKGLQEFSQDMAPVIAAALMRTRRANLSRKAVAGLAE